LRARNWRESAVSRVVVNGTDVGCARVAVVAHWCRGCETLTSTGLTCQWVARSGIRAGNVGKHTDGRSVGGVALVVGAKISIRANDWLNIAQSIIDVTELWVASIRSGTNNGCINTSGDTIDVLTAVSGAWVAIVTLDLVGDARSVASVTGLRVARIRLITWVRSEDTVGLSSSSITSVGSAKIVVVTGDVLDYTQSIGA